MHSTPSCSSWNLFRPQTPPITVFYSYNCGKEMKGLRGLSRWGGGDSTWTIKSPWIGISLQKGNRKESHSKSSRNNVLFLSSFYSELYDLETKRLFSFCGQAAIAFLPSGPGEAPGPGFPPLWICLSNQPGLPESFEQPGLPESF